MKKEIKLFALGLVLTISGGITAVGIYKHFEPKKTANFSSQTAYILHGYLVGVSQARLRSYQRRTSRRKHRMAGIVSTCIRCIQVVWRLSNQCLLQDYRLENPTPSQRKTIPDWHVLQPVFAKWFWG